AMTLASSLAVARQELLALSPEEPVGAGGGAAGVAGGGVDAGNNTHTEVAGHSVPAPGVPPGEEDRMTPNRVLSWDLSGSQDKAGATRPAVNRGELGSATAPKLPPGARPVGSGA